MSTLPKPLRPRKRTPSACSVDGVDLPPTAWDAADALLYAEIGAIGVFDAAAFLAGDLGTLASIALTAAIGFGLRLGAERRLTGRS